jgi:predicted choloylglycine hydrolase
MATPCKQFNAVHEAQPGTKWLTHARAALPGYRKWFASEGEIKRPGLGECRTALATHMPEMLPLWEKLLGLLQADELSARLLSFYCPAVSASGCSQAVWTRYTPTLVRNYDFVPALCEGRLLQSAWHDTRVIASTDCLWGALDGMNEHGLSVSMAFGGKDAVGSGFGIAIILRYLLEFCTTVDEAVKVLQRVPCHMAYNVTVLDAHSQVRTVELTPGSAAKVCSKPMAVNHQGDFELTNYAMVSNSHERHHAIMGKLCDPQCNVEAFANAFEYSPLFCTGYTQGMGTLYTAIYNPQLRAMELRWPRRQRMYQSFAHFEECDLWVELA